MTQTVNDLQRIAANSSHIRFDLGQGGLPRAQIASPSCAAEFYLHGAHLCAWQPRGHKPVLWMSDHAVFADGKPIRGGVPICFPWFGPKADAPNAPAHGLVRIQAWQLKEVLDSPDRLLVSLTTQIEGWAVGFEVAFGATLGLKLTMTNTASTAATAEAALHTYFTVGDARQVSITGLENTDYLDKVDSARRKNQGDQPVRFTAETDRVYLSTQAACVLHDPVLNRRITIEKTGSRATVVWNPWIDKSAKMPDFGDDEWPGMCCIETAAVGEHAVTLAPGGSHEMTATISVQQPA